MIGIIDYGLGNLRSVEKAIKRVGYECIITRDWAELKRSESFILPGVGHFGRAMDNLKKFGLIEMLEEIVIGHQRPVLGICLGMQLMTEFSEEGNCKGLGWINGRTCQFCLTHNKVPHIGWNTLSIEGNIRFGADFNPKDEFYFVHSFYVSCINSEDILFRTKYEIEFVSGFLKNNIMGVQFHPEKSHLSGLNILRGFLTMHHVQT